MNLRKMIEEDLHAVLEIENESFISPWSKEQFKYELNENPYAKCIVIEDDGEIVGFIDYWITFEICQINQIAIKKEKRKKGYATKMLHYLFLYAINNEVDLITLEVRTKNESAIAFYEKNGFEIILAKKQYYENGDDAFYMIKRVGELNAKDYSSN